MTTPSSSTPPPNPWAAAVQNLAALAAIVTLTLADKIQGEVAVGMILAVTGVIALPALRRGGTPGSVGILALCTSPVLRTAGMIFGLHG